MSQPLETGAYEGYLSETYAPAMISRRWLSVNHQYDSSCGGAHPSSGLVYDTYDLSAGTKVDLPDWFDSRHQDMPEPYTEAQLQALVALLVSLRRSLTALRWIAGHEDLDTAMVPASDERALQDVSRYITLAPRDVRAFDQRGNIYASMGDFERAISNFDEVVRLAPENPAGYMNRGQAYAKAGNWKLAISDFDQAIRLDPKYPVAYFDRGNAHKERGDIDRAIRDYSEAIRSSIPISPWFSIISALAGSIEI
jgi:tetratricopeptide (TPR) repeat protein